MMEVIFAGIGAGLYLLGMRMMYDWLPMIEQYSGRTLSSFTKAKLLLSWPAIVVLDLIAARIEMDR